MQKYNMAVSRIEQVNKPDLDRVIASAIFNDSMVHISISVD